MTIVVDPYLIAIPYGDDINTDHVVSYTNRLNGWVNVFRSDPDYVVSGAVMRIIYSMELQPEFHILEKLFKQYGLVELSARDLAESCQTLMENYPHMEDRAGANDLECKQENQKIIPEHIRARLHPKIAEVFSGALISTSYALNLLEDKEEWLLATAPLEDQYSEILAVGQVRDNAAIVDVERPWTLLFKPAEYIETIEYNDKIIKAVIEKSPYDALKISWSKIKKNNPTIKEIEKYEVSFNPLFINSVRDKIFKKRPQYKKDLERVFDSIVFSISDIWKFASDKHHALREKIQDRTSKQKIRDRKGLIDSAGRIEVIGGNTPLHVHYWQCADEKYEISNITNDHDDATINY